MKKLIYSKEDLDLILSIEMQKQEQEIERLNNIINEIKEYIKYQIENLDFEKDTKAKMLGCMILNMLKELKDSDKE